MAHVTSRDGTAIAYDATGDGPLVLLVGGGLTDRSENEPLVPLLAERGFTTCNYDRRGRGGSGDTTPYAVEHEVEDVAALVDALGGGTAALVFGASSGGALALEAAAAGVPIAKLAVYEVPYLIGDYMLGAWGDYVPALHAALEAGDRGGAVELFMRLAGSSDEGVTRARQSGEPWEQATSLAHTLAYDAAVLGDGAVPRNRLEAIGQPVLAAAGVPEGFFADAADAIAEAVPHAERVTLKNQGHVADPQVLAAELARFFRAGTGAGA